jgi:hypothetical protein
MEASAAAAVEASASPAVTAATALRECCHWRESKTEESNQCDEGSTKESAHKSISLRT